MGRTLFLTKTSALLLALAAHWNMSLALADDYAAAWKAEEAGRYLDLRMKSWLEFGSADRGEGESKSSCVSCHTLAPYALARPALRKLAGQAEPTEYESKILSQTRMRVEHWRELDSARFQLLYDSNEQKKKESWGTEAVLNALLLASNDKDRKLPAPSDATTKAMANLWQAQARGGVDEGSWDWLDFGLEPWEAGEARYFGATLAAIAVATAPGYYTPSSNAALDESVGLLRDYLMRHRAEQNLFNRTWLLWASHGLDGLLTPVEREKVVGELVAAQQSDGGWRLASLGAFSRQDGEPQDAASDGYATGLVLHVIQLAGTSKDSPAVVRGLDWLRANQRPTGQWSASSLNKKRDPSSNAGHFMSDAATAFAALALIHSTNEPTSAGAAASDPKTSDPATGAEKPPDGSPLRKAVTFYASFDAEPKGDFGQGDLRLWTRADDPAEKGKTVLRVGFDEANIGVDREGGVSGGALAFRGRSPGNALIFFPAKGKLAMHFGGWGGAVSLWFKADLAKIPQEAPWDPFLLAEKSWNDGAIWCDFAPGAAPRDLRIGLFPALTSGKKPPTLEEGEAIWLRAKAPTIAATDWHQIVQTWGNIDTGKADAWTACYLDGVVIGKVEGRHGPMGWDLDDVRFHIGSGLVGMIDEVALFDRPITEAEVKQLHEEPGILRSFSLTAP